MSICFSEKKEGIVAIAGHVGCGHCHSLNNQVQDDSSGLSTVLEILKEASGISMELEDILFDGNWITAVMKNGGIGKGYARGPHNAPPAGLRRRLSWQLQFLQLCLHP